MARRARTPRGPDGFTRGLVFLAAGLALAVAGLGVLNYHGAAQRRGLEAKLDENHAACEASFQQLDHAHLEDRLRATRLWALLELTVAIQELDERDFGPARNRLVQAARHLRRGAESGDRSLATSIEAIELGADTDLGMAKRVLASIRNAVEDKLPTPPIHLASM